MDKQKLIFLLFSAVAVLISCPAFAGTIDPLNNDSQYAYGENVGWWNFEPSFGPGVTVMDTTVTGFVWQENIGWINLGPMPFGGVLNDGNFNLSGWAWGENVGWISFSCANTSSCATVDYGVTIDCNGNFNGWAWGENIGWIALNSTSPPESPVPFKVQSAWYCLRIADVGNTMVKLSWTGNSEYLAGFLIQLAPDNGGSPGAWSRSIDAGNPSGSYYAINNLSPCTKFWFRLIAYNISGEYSAYSNIVSAMTLCPTTTTTTMISSTTTTAPTVIELSTFTATAKNNTVILEWETEAEIENAGFNVYRAESEDGEYIKINEDLIAAEGSSTQGASYEFIDGNVKNRNTYYYKLEDVDTSGKSTFHGPIEATPRLIYGLRK